MYNASIMDYSESFYSLEHCRVICLKIYTTLKSNNVDAIVFTLSDPKGPWIDGLGSSLFAQLSIAVEPLRNDT